MHDRILETGRSQVANIVAGVVVTGDSDGAQHIVGNIANFCPNVGFAVAPSGTLTVLWEGQRKGAGTSWEELVDHYEEMYAPIARGAAENLAGLARRLREHPLSDVVRPS